MTHCLIFTARCDSDYSLAEDRPTYVLLRLTPENVAAIDALIADADAFFASHAGVHQITSRDLWGNWTADDLLEEFGEKFDDEDEPLFVVEDDLPAILADALVYHDCLHYWENDIWFTCYDANDFTYDTRYAHWPWVKRELEKVAGAASAGAANLEAR